MCPQIRWYRHTDLAKGRDREQSGANRHRLGESAVLGQISGRPTFDQETYQDKESGDTETVAEHVNHGAYDCVMFEAENTQQDKTHVCKRHVADQTFYILLRESE